MDRGRGRGRLPYRRLGSIATVSSTPSSIMESLDSVSLIEQTRVNDRMWESPPDVTLRDNLGNIHLDEDSEMSTESILLLDNEEVLQVSSEEQFSSLLGLSTDSKVKVVSIMGNTGDGKSHTLNHTFFNGNEVFATSTAASSATMGVWAAYDALLNVLVFDTEGLMGSTANENQRTRLLLKVLAVSDLVIYRTRAERLYRDLFTFLGSASRAFTKHFQAALLKVPLTSQSVSSLGPAVIIFHETKHTKPLTSSLTECPEDSLRKRFAELNLAIDAFSSLRYIGTQTCDGNTDFSGLRSAAQAELVNISVRSPRSPDIIFKALRVLNERFSDELSGPSTLFPDQYFTCPVQCLSCNNRCESSMGHQQDCLPHASSTNCVYQSLYENYIYLCKKCHIRGVRQVVTPKSVSDTSATWYGLAKYVWTGYSIDCPVCGELYASRSYWYGNAPPEDCSSVRTEVRHVWPGTAAAAAGESNAAQRVVDGVSYITDAVSGVVTQPTKVISSYVADQIAPKYWRPNHEITHCTGCKSEFAAVATKHHCRSCGEGFCDGCSGNSAPVPHHGWNEPVRVCDACYSAIAKNTCRRVETVDPADVRVRRYGEILAQTVSTVATVIDYSKGLIKDSARPAYWVPDGEITNCCVCDVLFDSRVQLHHCRDCGKGVCDVCSGSRQAVPHRGWSSPVRVCDNCAKPN